jgi:hypothetical protein
MIEGNIFVLNISKSSQILAAEARLAEGQFIIAGQH